MEEQEKNEVQQAIQEIILTSYEPCDGSDPDNTHLMTTDMVKDKINDFSGFGLKNIDIYNAMVDLGFRIVNAGDKFYWRVTKK